MGQSNAERLHDDHFDRDRARYAPLGHFERHNDVDFSSVYYLAVARIE